MNANNFLDPILEKFRPHMASAAVTASAYAERALAILEQIRENTEVDDPDQQDRRVFQGGIALNEVRDIVVVPTGETWVIRYLYVSNTGAVLNLLIDGKVVWQSPGVTQPVFRIRGGTQIQVQPTGAGPTDFFVIFETQQKKPRRTGRQGGIRQYLPDHSTEEPDPRQEAQQTSRHASPGVFAGNNVIGDRADAYKE